MRNKNLATGLAVALIVLGLLNAALGSVTSGLIVAAAGAVMLLRLRFFPNYGARRKS